MAKIKSGKIEVEVVPFGPAQDVIDRIRETIFKSKLVVAILQKANWRLLSVEFPEADGKAKAPAKFSSSAQFLAIIYDYTNERTLDIRGTLNAPSRWVIEESSRQPPVATEEFEEAVEILREGAEFGPRLKDGSIIAVQPMPPVFGQELEDGRTQRYVGIDLLENKGSRTLEILGVRLTDKSLLRFAGQVPSRSNPGTFSTCGAPVSAGQPVINRHAPGQVRVTIRSNQKTIWTFLAVRPATSSGTNGSGIELRFVDLRGQRMLYRAHVPILNVKYGGDKCGPYRDWQWQEGQISAAGTPVSNTGFILCNSPAKTIMDTGSDSGNVLGTAIFIDGSEVVLVNEMQAGWYRYVSQWRFHVDGTLKPRFGFAAVQNSCVCNVHHHHAYWRFDFDILTAGGNRVEEYNNPPLVSGSNWHRKAFEIRRPRDPSRHRHWKVTNIAKKSGVEIYPGPNDGIASQMPDAPFGRGDVWILKYRGSEIDDGVAAVGPPYEAGLDQWINGEKVDDTDIVLWYAGHFTHDLSHEDPATHGHILGPDIRPVNWPA